MSTRTRRAPGRSSLALMVAIAVAACGGGPSAAQPSPPARPAAGPPGKAQPAPAQPAPAQPAASTAAAPALTPIPKKLPPHVTVAPGAPTDAPPPPLVRTERQLMGTIWMVSISGGEEAAAKAAGTRALDEVARLESVLSEWQPNSEISRVNAAAGKAPVKVGPELLDCVKASLETARWSHGAFDISWAALRGLWDFSADSKQTPPSQDAVKALLPLWNYRNIVLDEKRGTVFLKKKGMQIGLGGIAKGYALDRASELLQQAGFKDFMIFGGGQVLVHGLRGSRPWRVGIQHPRDNSYFAYVEVTDASVATSGDYEHSYFFENERYHHIIDPKTGFPAEQTASVTVIAKSALWADAVDTAVFVLGPDAGLRALAKAPHGAIDGVAVDPQLHVFATAGGAKRLIFSNRLEANDTIGAPLAPGDPHPQLSPASIR